MSAIPAGRGSGRAPQRPESPRRVKHGLRLQSKEGPRAENWVAQRWIEILEQVVGPSEAKEGLAYARTGQTVSLEVHSGLVEAAVQGRAPKPYMTQIRFPALNEAQWHEVVVAMAAEAMYAAKLLAGEIPQALEELFEPLGLELLPAQPTAYELRCTCDESSSGPCKHAAAVGFLVADRLSQEPSLLFSLYGMSAERVLEWLRQARAAQAPHGESARSAFVGYPDESAIPGSGGAAAPLETCLDDFWRCGPQLAELEQSPPSQHVAHALLRRLGPSPMNGKFPMVGLLASIYDEVSAAAIRVRDRAERLANGSVDEEPS